MPPAYSEDRATLESDPSAAVGEYTEGRGFRSALLIFLKCYSHTLVSFMFDLEPKTTSAAQFRYLRTTGSLNAQVALSFPYSSRICFFGESEACAFTESMRRRNVVARLGGPNNNYLLRAAELSNRTVIEVRGIGTSDHMLAVGEHLAESIEKLAVLATTLVMQRAELHRKLGIATNRTDELNLAVTNGFKRIRCRSKRAPRLDGIIVDKTFCNRFTKCGFIDLFRYLQSTSDLISRVVTSTDWLLESRREPRLGAAVVKTAIALESLLVFSESESLARTLSERSAFILSNSPEVRRRISAIILRFYDVRSGVVHGSQKKAKKLTPSLIECVDRLALMLHLVIASNADLWSNVDSLRLWCELQKWDKPFSNLKFPLSKKYLHNALELMAAEMPAC